VQRGAPFEPPYGESDDTGGSFSAGPPHHPRGGYRLTVFRNSSAVPHRGENTVPRGVIRKFAICCRPCPVFPRMFSCSHADF